MKHNALAAALLCVSAPAMADHVPATASVNPLVTYQHDAAQKRYADILKIADLIADYQAATDTLPFMGGSGSEVYEVAVLGQQKAVDAVFQNGTPFGFSLSKYRPQVFRDTLVAGLGRDIALPIDPQQIGTHFAPVYFVFMRRAGDRIPAHYIVLGTFVQPVARSTQVAENVHLVAISDSDIPFIVPVQTRGSFDTDFIAHAMAAGRTADAAFARSVPVTLD